MADIERVQYRMLGNECIAILPDQPANPGRYLSYMRIGQHGECSRNIYTRARLATPDEYASLHAELTNIGYALRIVRRINPTP